jgi:hypothetical protein
MPRARLGGGELERPLPFSVRHAAHAPRPLPFSVRHAAHAPRPLPFSVRHAARAPVRFLVPSDTLPARPCASLFRQTRCPRARALPCSVRHAAGPILASRPAPYTLLVRAVTRVRRWPRCRRWMAAGRGPGHARRSRPRGAPRVSGRVGSGASGGCARSVNIGCGAGGRQVTALAVWSPGSLWKKKTRACRALSIRAVLVRRHVRGRRSGYTVSRNHTNWKEIERCASW